MPSKTVGDGDSGPIPGSSPGGPSRRTLGLHVVARTAGLGLVVVLWYVSRPLWHGMVYSMLFSPPATLFVGGSLLVALVLWYLPPWRVRAGETDPDVTIEFEGAGGVPTEVFDVEGTARRKLRVFGVAVVVLFFLSILVSIPAGALEQRTLAQQTMADATELEEFPQANPENPRVVPRKVSDISTRGSVSYRQHRLGPSDIARTEDGSLGWSYAIQPDGFRNRVVENQRGVLITGMTNLDERPIDVHEEDFEHGEGMFLHRSADWKLKSTDYIAVYNDDPVEFSHEGRPYMYYAKTGHEWHLTPFPHTTPTWDGGALVHPDGTVDHLTPEEARNNDILDGQRLYPLTLTRTEMDSLGYRNGIVNQMPVVGAHKGEIEVAGLPEGTGNSQPFVIDLAGERMTYVTAMEPFGEDTRGLDEVWFADAETGAYTFFGTDAETLTGPERAMGIARSADSRTNWGQNFVVAEPVPVTVDGDLWWHIKVAPTDFTDVTRNVFINAENGDAVEIRDDEAVRSFIRGNVSDVGTELDNNPGVDDRDPDRQTGTDDGPAYYIIVTDENGTVIERIPVEPGQDTRIVPADGDENGTASGTDGG